MRKRRCLTPRISAVATVIGLKCIALVLLLCTSASAAPSPGTLRAEAAAIDDTAAFLDEAWHNGVRCPGSMMWNGRNWDITRKIGETCGPWRRSEHDWSQAQNAVLAVEHWEQCGDMGSLPDQSTGYCSVCPVTWDATITAMREDAASIRKMVAALECAERLGSQQAAEKEKAKAEEAQKKKQEADEQRWKSDEEKRRKEDEKRRTDDEKRRKDKEARDAERAQKDAADREQRRERRLHQIEAQKDAEARNDAHAAELAGGLAGIAASGGGGNYASGLSSHSHLEIGLGSPWLPLYVFSGSTPNAEFTAGAGVAIGAEYWPLYGHHFGLGTNLNVMAGGFALSNGGTYALSATAGIQGFVGSEDGVSLIVEAGGGYRYGYETYDNSIDGNNQKTGDGGYGLVRLGAGVRVCVNDDSHAAGFCEDSLDFRAAIELPQGLPPDSNSWAPVVGFRWWSRRANVVDVDLSWAYPMAGAGYRVNSPAAAPDTGWMVIVKLCMVSVWDWFGDPYEIGHPAAQPDEDAAPRRGAQGRSHDRNNETSNDATSDSVEHSLDQPSQPPESECVAKCRRLMASGALSVDLNGCIARLCNTDSQ